MKLFSKHKVETLSQAKNLYAKGHYKKALNVCKNLINKNKDDFEAYNLLGDIHYKMGNKSKAVEVYRDLANKLEEDKFTERAIAVTRKIIRFFPDQLDLYRKISKLYSKKGLQAEHVNVLYELSDIYEERGEKDKAVDILKEIAEYNRSNAKNYFKIITKFNQYGKQNEVCRFIYHAFELADKYKNEKIIDDLLDIAAENDCELTNSVRFIIPYFKDSEENKELLFKYGKNYLHENFDESFFKHFTDLFNYDDDPGFFNEIKEKHNHIAIYNYLLQYMLDHRNYENVLLLLGEIAELPKYNFDSSVMNVIEKNYTSLDETEILEAMVIISERCEARDTTINIYKHLKNIYAHRGESEKAENLEQFIKDLEDTDFDQENDFYSNTDELDETAQHHNIEDFDNLMKQTSLDDEEKSENMLDSIDVDIKEEDVDDEDIFDLELNNYDEETQEENSDMEIELDLDELSLEKNVNKDTEERETEINSEESFDEIKGLEHNKQENSEEGISDSEEAEELTENLDELENLELNEINDDNIFTDTSEQADNETFDTEKYEEGKEAEIDNIKSLIDENSFGSAHRALDKLLQKYPEDEDVKNLATELILFSEETNTDNQAEDKPDDINSLTSEFKDVAKSIRESINEMIEPGDYETHYNMALAYMEMELYDDALTELKKSATSNKRYESLYLMAECYKLMENYEQAVNIHKLIIVDYSDKEKMLNSLYEMAYIYEIKGNTPVALNYYKKIYFLDENFRDVKDKIENPDSLDSVSAENEAEDIEENKTENKKKIAFL